MASMPRIGKTRASLEYLKHAVQMTRASGHDTRVVPIYVTYNRCTHFGVWDRALGADLSIAYRVLLEYASGNMSWPRDVVGNIAAAIGKVSLEDALDIIAMHAMQHKPNLDQLQCPGDPSSSTSPSLPALNSSNPPKVMFVLILDEFQRALINKVGNLGESVLERQATKILASR
ncbi:hypothetical protein CAOG_01741 [Capsaspora owczarzaki ATCC 30864]|uniref:hypothetical protein n=1 Tax=Capsaspora owczarzaki (strain ATCC 30864) TaxID=595528 RepID=UPI0001FE36AB|nr:hypothetical protein CAOG_01741 [Capsaspora owczarzaki ATCC 30864]|eukprot:XP_004364609.1 hypothetical protein CAOG_01741 [Capsaspora owczarzaki ATCC 30864]